MYRFAGGFNLYRLYECGEEKAYARVYADGFCICNYVACAPDDPRLLALIAQVAPVEVRPAAPHPPLAAKKSSDGSAAGFCPRRRWRPLWPPRCAPTPSLVVMRHNPTAFVLPSTATQ